MGVSSRMVSCRPYEEKVLGSNPAASK
jgi:hypothetical protein